MARSARSACALAVALAIAQPCAAQDGSSDSDSDPFSPENANTYYLGNFVPRRNVPPMKGCTVLGKVYWPITPDMFAKPYTIQHGWDWCQHKCENMWVSELDGTAAPCTHFAFYPDGKCFLQGKNVTLETAPECNMTNPCEHGFPVVSGPKTCDDQKLWAVPPADPTPPPTYTTTPEPTTTTTPPKLAGEGERCTPSLPPPYNVRCEEGLNCNTNGLLGAPGICSSKVGLGGECDINLGPSATKLCLDSLECGTKPGAPPGAPGVCQELTTATDESENSDTVVAAPVVVAPPPPPTTVTTTTVTTTSTTVTVSTTTTTKDLPPAGATITGWYYTPLGLQLSAPGWRGCTDLCKADVFCQHFVYYPHSSVCRTTGKDVFLQKATCENNETDCAELGVISGPRNLTDKALWPKIPVETTAPPATVAERAVDIIQDAGDGGGGGASPLLIVLVLALLGVLGTGVYGYNQGWFGGDSDDDDEEQYSDEESDGKPFAGS
uniref:Apple domain-containing protein n=1 Tax=Zooxanthella nutricula TaxID=1333877 RepID=A0A6U9QC35_9DINO